MVRMVLHFTDDWIPDRTKLASKKPERGAVETRQAIGAVGTRQATIQEILHEFTLKGDVAVFDSEESPAEPVNIVMGDKGEKIESQIAGGDAPEPLSQTLLQMLWAAKSWRLEVHAPDPDPPVFGPVVDQIMQMLVNSAQWSLDVEPREGDGETTVTVDGGPAMDRLALAAKTFKRIAETRRAKVAAAAQGEED